ncbi:hypothetical protein CHARACLAT_003733 [Characodon lateralis]|uniref:Uncharacterized protein n=1 Tax=Characodon lateralis TaxID=208331 RepID=A0ABU7CV85_9TELE|nr:hypothetical protein [Characodon lateralis]
MSGRVMERAEGGIQGWGGKAVGGKMLSQGASPPADPNLHPCSEEGGTGTSTGPKARDRHRAQSTDRKPGPTAPSLLEPPEPRNIDPQPPTLGPLPEKVTDP